MRVVTWNILSGQPTQDGGNLFNAIYQLDADVVALQEVDHLQSRSNEIKTIEEIAEKCGYISWAFAPALIGTPGFTWHKAESIHTHQNPVELKTSYGIGLLSRVPVISWHQLNLNGSPIGLPLLITTPKGMRVAYVADEPRVAIAAVLENGFTFITSHLSFVPGVNSAQLRKIKKWSKTLPGKKVFLGDFNALWFGKAKLNSLNNLKSYPAWSPKAKFDYIFSNDISANEIELPYLGVSDHRPLGIEINS